MARFYITTPIYYVNDRPHIGHLYTTCVADAIARYHRLAGDEVFFLTGVDEHAAKVADAAQERGVSPQQLADENAQEFQNTFERYEITNNDFIRTSQERHKERVSRLVAQLVESGDVYLGEYEGWYDAGEEEYVPENRAAEHDYKSPLSGRDLVRKKEENFFFRLSAYSDRLLELLSVQPDFVQPDARRNEVIGRIRDGLQDVPISRTGSRDWGIPMPNDPQHTIYVWIDALFNYLTAVDTDERRAFWPPQVHLIGKEILWFHAVIWPAVLMALKKTAGHEWIELPQQVYAHSYWISEGKKMSKSLGNFIDLAKLDHYTETYGMDALRYYLFTQGPMDVSDSDFADARFSELYNADLANKLGNLVSRTLNMTAKFAEARVPEAGAAGEAEQALVASANQAAATVAQQMQRLHLARALEAVIGLAVAANRYLDEREPWKAAKDPERADGVPTTLYHCCESIRILARLLEPFLPATAEKIFERLGADATVRTASPEWGGLPSGLSTQKGDALFPRHDSAKNS